MANTPLLVGVTGHRDVPRDCYAALSAKLREVLARFRKPAMLLSALAEGADRLAARTALDAGFELFAVLPMSVRLYEEDFATAPSLSAFRDLLAKASRVVELPLHPGDLNRGAQYEDAGRFIVRESAALIALWDGVDSNTRGGTSAVVRMATGRIPIYHIVTPRASS